MKQMKVSMLLGMIASAGLAAMNTGYAASGAGEDLLIGGPTTTTYPQVQYDAKANLLAITGGRGDDWLEVALMDDGDLSLNGVSLAKLGIRLEGIPSVVMDGGDGNDVLIACGLPSAKMNGGGGKDMLIWINGEGEFNQVQDGDELLVWNEPRTELAHGAGMDILIGNTGGDRLIEFENLDEYDLIDEGKEAALGGDDDLIGGWGNDWISGGTGRD